MSALAMILDAAARWPDRVAIEEADGNPVTYAALIARAHRFAERERGAGVVEVSAARSADFVARCLGAWIAGRAWTPLDPAEPAARREAIRMRVASATGNDLAYVIATSGSSGAPKAVMVGHRGIPALLRAQIAAFQLGAGDRGLWLHAPSFDASISDWGTALAAGATLVVPARFASAALPEAPIALPPPPKGYVEVPVRGAKPTAPPNAPRLVFDLDELATRAITHVDLPPALLAALGTPPPTLRVVVLGGEACPVERVRELARRVRVVVVYGPTEATVCASLVVVDPESWTRPLIGAPLPGVAFRAIDGELYIGGDCLALGYAGDPGETASRFVERDGTRFYRTGDRVEAVADGLAFVGRVDRQRKLRGRRIELDEIDAAIAACPGVRDAATEVRGPALVSFVDTEETAGALRDWLRVRVPVWMIPSRFVIGPLPRTATGKIDHAALAVRPLLSRPPEGADPLAAEIAALWCDALGVETVTDGDAFGDVGGDSLTAMTLSAAIAARALVLDPAFLSAARTFAELVSAIRTKSSGDRTLDVAECEHRGMRELAACTSADARPGHVASLRRSPSDPAIGERILLTGATGLLGSHLLRALPRDRVIALVRNPHHAPEGIEVVVGDLAQPWLGLSPDAWSKLVAEVGVIVHAGARVALPLDWDAHVDVNVTGTGWLVRLVAEAGAILHHVSTLAVFVGTDRYARHAFRADVPEPISTVFGGYAQTKVAAEVIARTVGARIHRLGMLVEDAPREGTQLGMIARGLAKLACVPTSDPALAFDVTPVAYAARAIAEHVLATPRTAGPAFVVAPPPLPATLTPSGRIPRIDAPHTAPAALTGGMPRLDAPNATTTGRVPRIADPVLHVAGRRAAFTDLAGGLPVIPAHQWADLARARLADPDIAMAYLSLARLHGDVAFRLRARPFDLFLATGMDFDAPVPPKFDVAATLAALR